jgi:hypothetical protein
LLFHIRVPSSLVAGWPPENFEPKKMIIVNRGSAAAKDIRLWVESKNENIKAKLVPVQRTKETYGFFMEIFPICGIPY